MLRFYLDSVPTTRNLLLMEATYNRGVSIRADTDRNIRIMNELESWVSLLASFSRNPPADDAAIRTAENDSNAALPSKYREFLQFTNGGEGFVGSGRYAALWRVEEICPFNKEYEVSERAPGLLLFGTDGGGECFGFDYRSPDRVIVQVPAIGMSLSDTLVIAPTFPRFLAFIGRQRL
jgi:hypothetical protein